MPSEVTVNIRSIAVGGAGIGETTAQSGSGSELLGIATFVPFTIPGEVVTAQVSQQKQRYLEARLLSVANPSSDRQSPRCSYYTICGGCELQHMTYNAQLLAKYEMIRGALRSARVPLDVVDKLQAISPSEPFHYRRRVTLHVDPQGRVGFYRAGSRSVVAIEQCEVAHPRINETLARAAQLGLALPGRISSIIIDIDTTGEIVLLRTPYDLGKSEQLKVLESAKAHFPHVRLLSAAGEVGGFGREFLELPLTEKGNLTLQIPAGCFSQVNWEINMRLIARAMELAQVKPHATVLDLYSGAGNFALPFARAGARVTAVETDPRLVACGRQNAKRYGLERTLEFYQGSVERYLEDGKLKGMLDAIIADPPRSGLGKVVPHLPVAKRLLLVSCHVPSFVRDLKGLIENGWRVESIEPFDMFAQTSYVEILSVLECG